MAYSQADIRIMAYYQRDICIHCIPKRALAFIVYPSGHSHSLHTQAGISIHCIPKRTFAFIAYLQAGIRIHDIPIRDICIIWTFTSWHSPKRTFTSWHTHKGAFTSWHIYMNSYIMTYLHKHLHHDIPTSGHSHHGMHQRDICIMTSLQEAFAPWHTHQKTFAPQDFFYISISTMRHLHTVKFVRWHHHG